MGVISRLYPDPETDVARQASEKHIRGFINNYPHLARAFITDEETTVTYRGRTAVPIRLSDNPVLHRAVKAFAARLGLALYFDLTAKIVPNDWWVVVRWQTNLQLDQDDRLDALLRSFGEANTLRMGKLSVPNEFRYWSGVANDAPDHFLCFAAFRESFGVTAIIRPPDAAEFEANPAVFRPGFLKSFRVRQ